MISILNICPICGSRKVYRFEEPGDDLPDGPWGVPCSKCEKSLFDQIECKTADTRIESSMPGFVDIHVGCLYGDPSAIDTARQMIGLEGV